VVEAANTLRNRDTPTEPAPQINVPSNTMRRALVHHSQMWSSLKRDLTRTEYSPERADEREMGENGPCDWRGGGGAAVHSP
jgi:hypothetical protein